MHDFSNSSKWTVANRLEEHAFAIGKYVSAMPNLRALELEDATNQPANPWFAILNSLRMPTLLCASFNIGHNQVLDNVYETPDSDDAKPFSTFLDNHPQLQYFRHEVASGPIIPHITRCPHDLNIFRGHLLDIICLLNTHRPILPVVDVDRWPDDLQARNLSQWTLANPKSTKIDVLVVNIDLCLVRLRLIAQVDAQFLPFALD